MNELDGKVAIATGGASGIGRNTCDFYARDGDRVVVSDVDEAGGQETVQTIRTAGVTWPVSDSSR